MESESVQVLDRGYVRLIESWGSDEQVIEAARMSTAKGFLGWGGAPCPECLAAGRLSLKDHLFVDYPACEAARAAKCACNGTGKTVGDEKLLKFLWDNAHATPFEMAGLTIEVKAPIMVFREWHRHRVPFGYNEMSARYVPLPDENYVPFVSRVMLATQATTNKQAQGSGKQFNEVEVGNWIFELEAAYVKAQECYEKGIKMGIPKELARLCVPVGRYSVMRATGNLRGWLGFLKLRCAPAAQWEIRQYANVVANLVRQRFPRTHEVAQASVGMP
jgi:thymidylate synthase (FAD)